MREDFVELGESGSHNPELHISFTFRQLLDIDG